LIESNRATSSLFQKHIGLFFKNRPYEGRLLAILFGEAKWTKKPVGIDILDNLKKRQKGSSGGRKKEKKSRRSSATLVSQIP